MIKKDLILGKQSEYRIVKSRTRPKKFAVRLVDETMNNMEHQAPVIPPAALIQIPSHKEDPHKNRECIVSHTSLEILTYLIDPYFRLEDWNYAKARFGRLPLRKIRESYHSLSPSCFFSELTLKLHGGDFDSVVNAVVCMDPNTLRTLLAGVDIGILARFIEALTSAIATRGRTSEIDVCRHIMDFVKHDLNRMRDVFHTSILFASRETRPRLLFLFERMRMNGAYWLLDTMCNCLSKECGITKKEAMGEAIIDIHDTVRGSPSESDAFMAQSLQDLCDDTQACSSECGQAWREYAVNEKSKEGGF